MDSYRNGPCGTHHVEFRLRRRLVGHWKDSRLHHYHNHRSAIVSCRWAKASVCCFHIYTPILWYSPPDGVFPETIDLLSIYWLICHVILAELVRNEILSSKYLSTSLPFIGAHIMSTHTVHITCGGSACISISHIGNYMYCV